MNRLSSALAAAVPALAVLAWFNRPESAAEWAAWVQTFGVLVAISWSVRLQSQATRQGEQQMQQMAALFATNMHWVFRELHDACAKQSGPDYAVHRRMLVEILTQGREVPLQLLDGRALAMVTSLRSLAVEALELTEPQPQGSVWHALQDHFDRRLPQIAAWLAAAGHPPESSGPTDYAGLRTSYGQLGGR